MSNYRLVEEQIFQKEDFTNTVIPLTEFEACKFINCNFEKAQMNSFKFIDCEFIGCNLSLINVDHCMFQDIVFKDCKILGVLFEHCNTFNLSLRFEQCTLEHSSFFRLKLSKTKFSNCSLRDTDWEESDLTQAIFENCDLGGAKFINTTLAKADFLTAYDFDIDPERNQVKGAKFSMSGLPGLLYKYNLKIFLTLSVIVGILG